MLKKFQIPVMIIPLVLFVVTSFFIFPQADDFAYASSLMKLGFWEAQVNMYMEWSGRYIATAFLSASPLAWGNLRIYRFYPVLLVLLLFLSSVFMVQRVFRERLLKGESWFFGLALTYLMIVGFHSISEGLYWLAGSYTYTVSLVLFNFAVAYLWRDEQTLWSIIFLILASFTIIGTNETIMVLWLYTLGVTELLHWLRNGRIRKGLVLVFACSFIFALIVYLAPGNSFRASQFEKSRQVFRTLGNATLYSFIDPFKFLTIPLIAFFALNFERIRSLVALEFFQRRRYLLLGLWMAVIFVSFAPSLWGMGRRPNTRTMNVIVYFHLLGFFPVAVTFIKAIPQKIPRALFVLALALSLNTFNLVRDYFGPIQAYQKRWARIVESGGKDIPDVEKLPKSIYFRDTEDFEEGFEYFFANNPQFFK